MELFIAILPVFLLLMMGGLLQRWRFPFDGFWQGVDKLVYWCLFPALLFSKTSVIDFANPMLLRYGMVLVSALAVTALVIFITARWLQVSAPTTTSMLQAAVRFNTFITLALAERLYGAEGLVLAALGAAVLIPSVNVFLVVSMVSMHGQKQQSLAKLIAKELLRNPLILAIAAGLGLNALGLTPIPIVSDMAQMLAQATLPLVLLAVGAGVRLTTVRAIGASFWLSAAGRFLVFPSVVLLVCYLLEINGLAAYVALLFGIVPTATSGYALAKQLGGDADSLAAFITLQTAMSLLTVPVSIALAHLWLG
ncbi:Membrane transport protein [Marinomonas aquimarina]|uniref:Membrane transport protein n=1 Tax=Marinomonas aquimarina TaxID=295068 RepID=A0A1A8T3D8_9GAMM|nr:AEC family transporter [Marinomonas aquimarina]SBS25286.1 Membrane transport protein [Marinomonas aquimarina]